MNISFWIVLIAFLVGANCSLIGSFLMLRCQSMLADAISHAVLLGIVLAFLWTNSMHPLVLLGGAIVAGIATTFLISFFQSQVRVSADAAIGITFTSFFALGIILISLYTEKVDLDVGCVLYGELQMIPFDVWIYKGYNMGPKAVYLLGVLLLFNVLMVLICYPMLFLTSFDPAFATVIGVNTKFWDYLLMMATSITAVMLCKVVGAVLVVAFLVVPPATAYLVTKSLPNMLLYALFLNIIVAFGGYELAARINGSIAGAMVVVAGSLFGLAFFLYKSSVNRLP